MEYIHVRNLERYHPGYKDRVLSWAKIYFTIIQGDPEFELINEEIDKWRFVAMICLELEAKSPLPNTEQYWKLKHFNLKKRPIALTLKMLHRFIDIVSEEAKEVYRDPYTDKEKDKEKEEEREKKDGVALFSVPVELATLEVVETLRRFNEHRKEMKRPTTSYGRNLLVKRLMKLSAGNPDTAVKIVEQSIEAGWQGIFPLKDTNNGHKPKNSQTSRAEFSHTPEAAERFTNLEATLAERDRERDQRS